MNIYRSSRWINDVNQATASLPELDQLAGKSILITGASGLICSTVIDILLQYNNTHPKKITIFAAGRQFSEMTDRFGDFCTHDDFIYVPYDATLSTINLSVKADYIIHGASNASPNLIISEPVETMLCNFNGILNLLKYAQAKETQRLLFISSSEVYGLSTTKTPYREDEYGYINLLNPRNSYSISKRAAETLCVSFSAEYGVESLIVRPGHIYGPTASPYDTRISSAFAWAAAKGENLIMKSKGMQLRSYCHCLDCASAILIALINGKPSQAYNISNPNSIITIRDLAEQLAKAGNVNLLYETADPFELSSYNPMTNSALDSSLLEKLGWKCYYNAHLGTVETIEVLKDMIHDAS